MTSRDETSGARGGRHEEPLDVGPLLLDALAIRVVGGLTSAGIAYVLLKGQAFALTFFDGVGRTSGDVDVLVAPESFDAACAALEALGMRRKHGTAGITEASVHAVELVDPLGEVDLHWRIPGIGNDPAETWRVLASSTQDLELGSSSVRTLDRSALLLTLVVNAVHSGSASADRDLSKVAGEASDADWRTAWSLAERLGSHGWMRSGMSLHPDTEAVAQRLGLAAPLPLEAALVRDDTPVAAGLLRVWRRPGLRNKLRMLAREIVPSADGMRYWRPSVGESRVRLAAAYLLRPVYLATRLPGAVLSLIRARREFRRGRGDDGRP